MIENTPWDFVEVTEQDRLRDKLEATYGPCDARHKHRIGQRVLCQGTAGDVLWVVAPQKAGMKEGVWYPELPRRYIVKRDGEQFPTPVYRTEIYRFIQP